MTIGRETWERYVATLSSINGKAKELMLRFIAENGIEQVPRLVAEGYAVATYYGEAAGALAAEMYDAIAAAEAADVPAAEAAATASMEETQAAITQVLKKSQNEDLLAAAIARLVKLAAEDTMLKNAARDKAEYAWVPHGDTCGYCITLASRGWRATTPSAAKNHAPHIHSHCDCEYVVRFDHDSNVEGYDPERYQEMYDDAPIGLWNTPDGAPPAGAHVEKQRESVRKINAMRREFYARDKVEINAQKRSAYAKRRERARANSDELS